MLCRPDGGTSDKNPRFAAVAAGHDARPADHRSTFVAFVGDNILDFPGLTQASAKRATRSARALRHEVLHRAQSDVRELAAIDMAAPRISVFPKCYFDELVDGRRNYVDWIHDAATLGGEGVEHYDEFFPSYDERDVAPVMDAMAATGQISSMMCFSPNFTHPDRDERARQVERQKRAIDLTVRTGARHCRTLSGQKYPGLSIEEGVARAAECIARSLEYAVKRDVVLCLENHYKVGHWLYPEFAQQEEPFLALLDALAGLTRISASSTIRRMPSSEDSTRSRFSRRSSTAS